MVITTGHPIFIDVLEQRLHIISRQQVHGSHFDRVKPCCHIINWQER